MQGCNSCCFRENLNSPVTTGIDHEANSCFLQLCKYICENGKYQKMCLLEIQQKESYWFFLFQKWGSKCPKYKTAALLRGNCSWCPLYDIGKPIFSVQLWTCSAVGEELNKSYETHGVQLHATHHLTITQWSYSNYRIWSGSVFRNLVF